MTDITGAGLLGLINPELELPGQGNEVISLKGNAVNKQAFEEALAEYYSLRGWDKKTGLFTEKSISDMGLHHMSEFLINKDGN